MKPATLHFSPEQFDLRRALRLAQAAELVYERPGEIKRRVRDEWGFSRCRFLDVEGTQLFIAMGHEATIVSFRGTENDLADWLTDVDYDLVSGPLGGQVHEGFYDALSDVWQALHDEVVSHDPQQRKALWVTGHSLGGALATLATARWFEMGRIVNGLYTFGQPRTGDAAFCRNFNFVMRDSTFRFVNDNDIVSELPPTGLGFSHLGSLKYFGEEGRLEKKVTWWQRLVDRWTFDFDKLFSGTLEATADHSMIAYRKLIESALAQQKSSDLGDPADQVSIFSATRTPISIPRRRAA